MSVNVVVGQRAGPSVALRAPVGTTTKHLVAPSAARGLRSFVAPSVARGLLLSFALTIAPTATQAQQHPSIFLTKAEARAIREAAPKYPLLAKSVNEAKAVV